jgi:SGT1 protein.
MDIFNRTPAISEDTVQYTLYPRPDLSDKASVTTFAACIHSYVDSLLPNFIWHRDAFELKVVSDPHSEGWMLEGRTRVGDCVDDEWCTVWLLKEVSSKWDVVVRYIKPILV